MSLVNKKGVDIGDHNGKFNFEAAKKAGYEFAMLKLGYGSDIPEQDDAQFERSVQECERLGIPWGAWLYSYALNEDQARSELAHMLRLLKGKRPTMPIALDVEDSDDYRKNHGGWTYQNVNSCTKIVLEGLAKAGYYPALYTGFEEIENYLSRDIWQKYDMWFAHWATKCGYRGDNLSIWQYGGEVNYIESPYINGVDGKVDKDICYKDYPTIIKEGGFNNWGTPAPDPEPQPDNPTCTLTIQYLAKDGYLSEGEQVRTAQRLLRELDYPGADMLPLTVDGIFGSNTDYAVKCFQKGNGLSADGIIGKDTWKVLIDG